MKILSSEAVRVTKRTLEVESIERARKLREEESKACKAFATTKKDIQEKKAAMLEDYRQSMEALSRQRNALISEVNGLEKRKKIAEAPVDLKIKEMEALREQAAKDLETAEAFKREALEAQDKAEDLLDTLSELQDALAVREYDLDSKESKLKLEEERLTSSSNELSRKWMIYHQKVVDMNAEFMSKKFEVEALSKANQVYKESLDAMRLEQDKAKIAIRDGYASLAKAREEILGRKT